MASNLKGAIDPAFTRRFQAMIYFPPPDAAARLRLWRAALSALPERRLGPVDVAALARDHEIAGGSIINVLRRAALRACRRRTPVSERELREDIARELAKEGRV